MVTRVVFTTLAPFNINLTVLSAPSSFPDYVNTDLSIVFNIYYVCVIMHVLSMHAVCIISPAMFVHIYDFTIISGYYICNRFPCDYHPHRNLNGHSHTDARAPPECY